MENRSVIASGHGGRVLTLKGGKGVLEGDGTAF